MSKVTEPKVARVYRAGVDEMKRRTEEMKKLIGTPAFKKANEELAERVGTIERQHAEDVKKLNAEFSEKAWKTHKPIAFHERLDILERDYYAALTTAKRDVFGKYGFGDTPVSDYEYDLWAKSQDSKTKQIDKLRIAKNLNSQAFSMALRADRAAAAQRGEKLRYDVEGELEKFSKKTQRLYTAGKELDRRLGEAQKGWPREPDQPGKTIRQVTHPVDIRCAACGLRIKPGESFAQGADYLDTVHHPSCPEPSPAEALEIQERRAEEQREAKKIPESALSELFKENRIEQAAWPLLRTYRNQVGLDADGAVRVMKLATAIQKMDEPDSPVVPLVHLAEALHYHSSGGLDEIIAAQEKVVKDFEANPKTEVLRLQQVKGALERTLSVKKALEGKISRGEKATPEPEPVAAARTTEPDKEKKMNKEPWQMRQEEYATLMAKQSAESGPWDNKLSLEDRKKFWRTMHRDRIGERLEEGKPVSPEVLKDYPELVAEFKPAGPARPPAADAPKGKPEVTVTAKEPWQMTREEFAGEFRPVRNFQAYSSEQRALQESSRRLGHRQRTSLGENFYTHPLTGVAYPSAADAKQGARLTVIREALSEGKPVPPEVLADYPELAAKVKTAPEPVKPAPEAPVAPARAATVAEGPVAVIVGGVQESKKEKTVKSPGQMTDREYFKMRGVSIDSKKAARSGRLDELVAEHEIDIVEAITEGKPIPDAVFRDHPNLRGLSPADAMYKDMISRGGIREVVDREVPLAESLVASGRAVWSRGEDGSRLIKTPPGVHIVAGKVVEGGKDGKAELPKALMGIIKKAKTPEIAIKRLQVGMGVYDKSGNRLSMDPMRPKPKTDDLYHGFIRKASEVTGETGWFYAIQKLWEQEHGKLSPEESGKLNEEFLEWEEGRRKQRSSKVVAKSAPETEPEKKEKKVSKSKSTAVDAMDVPGMDDVVLYGGIPVRFLTVVRHLTEMAQRIDKKNAVSIREAGIRGFMQSKRHALPDDVQPLTYEEFEKVSGMRSGESVPAEIMAKWITMHPKEERWRFEKKADEVQAPKPADLQGFEDSRSDRSRESDERQAHSLILDPDDPRSERWMRDPGSADILGVDTPSKKSGKSKKGTRGKSRSRGRAERESTKIGGIG